MVNLVFFGFERYNQVEDFNNLAGLIF